ncbi:MAG: alpha/beta hydrolase [Tannerellaceae bacterium]|nr:alpha/beta hydrolase [Tannerellaceae bacterium]
MIVITVLAGVFNLMAQESISLFPGSAPGETAKFTEICDTTGGKIGGETICRMSNVGDPEITIYPAQANSTNVPAMVVCPGGGYSILAYDLEGEEVCRWLNGLGITGVLLKYRVPRREGREKHDAPLQDVQRAIGLVRANASIYGIDPQRIGVMGFSAGAHLAATVSNNFSRRTYPAVDDADTVSCRPDFCLLVYPAYLDAQNFSVANEVKPSAQTPPTLLIQAEDDKYYIKSSLFYYYALMEAGVPAWMHLYSKGGHGYGLRDTGATVNEWPYRAEDWFREINVISF